MPYLNIEYMDGRTETILVNDSIGAIRAREGQLIVVGGDGSYRTRGNSEASRCTTSGGGGPASPKRIVFRTAPCEENLRL
jgi:hypothetical protein